MDCLVFACQGNGNGKTLRFQIEWIVLMYVGYSGNEKTVSIPSLAVRASAVWWPLAFVYTTRFSQFDARGLIWQIAGINYSPKRRCCHHLSITFSHDTRFRFYLVLFPKKYTHVSRISSFGVVSFATCRVLIDYGSRNLRFFRPTNFQSIERFIHCNDGKSIWL